MKIRKGLLAAATATTVALTGVVAAPAYAAPETGNTSTNKTEDQKRIEELEKKVKSFEDKEKAAADKAARDQAEKERRKQIRENGSFEERSSLAKEDAFLNPDGTVSIAKITGWIGLFTTILGAITTLINFVQKNFNIKR